MKKILVRGAIVCVVLAVVAAGGVYLYIRSLLPAQEERISFGNDKILNSIDAQLADVDVAAVEKKTDQIYNKSISELQALVRQEALTYEEIVAFYLLRIRQLDQNADGINSVSEINPKAMEQARAKDAEYRDAIGRGDSLEDLFGMPVLLKENINTSDMPTSAGTHALRDFVPDVDAPFVRQLRGRGAIVLGKTNLSELSNFMSTKNPSGYSGKKGQTHNPFGPLEISPLGSSSGSAAAMALDLAAVSFGSETTGSIMAPASVHSVVGFKPTKDNIDAGGVVPISSTLDTIGPLGKRVEDVVAAYNAAATTPVTPKLSGNPFEGKRVGVAQGLPEDFAANLKAALEFLGATVVEMQVDETDLDNTVILFNDFERDFNAWLTEHKAPISSLVALAEYNRQDPETRMRYGQNLVEQSLSYSEHDDAKVANMVRTAQSRLDLIMAEHNVDVIVSKDNDSVLVPCIAGAPEITVPFGTYDGKPAGAMFFAQRGADTKLLEYAYAFEQHTKRRHTPPTREAG
ncbi:amidase family protein [Corynebacterium sp.]|uniref:amidase family protein n=1 Tax=Corynebacterium sp. TaxID=1720 RepID=UPI0026DCB19D|nr:amidase family protein [Corynebacterium sp.]MDO5077951.1 amidase family protein [Corynebacterium sp.]